MEPYLMSPKANIYMDQGEDIIYLLVMIIHVFSSTAASKKEINGRLTSEDWIDR